LDLATWEKVHPKCPTRFHPSLSGKIATSRKVQTCLLIFSQKENPTGFPRPSFSFRRASPLGSTSASQHFLCHIFRQFLQSTPTAALGPRAATSQLEGGKVKTAPPREIVSAAPIMTMKYHTTRAHHNWFWIATLQGKLRKPFYL